MEGVDNRLNFDTWFIWFDSAGNTAIEWEKKSVVFIESLPFTASLLCIFGLLFFLGNLKRKWKLNVCHSLSIVRVRVCECEYLYVVEDVRMNENGDKDCKAL